MRAPAALLLALLSGPALAQGAPGLRIPGPSLGPSSPGRGGVLPVPPAAEPAKPEPPKPTATAKEFTDALFARLAATRDAEEAKGIAQLIERIWLRSGSDTADLLMQRAMQAMAAKETDAALTLLSRIVEIEPDWAEAWNRRATLRYMIDDIDGSMRDAQHALALEPRHYGALTGIGVMLQSEGFDARALDAYRRALSIYPALESIRKSADKLSIEVEGRGT